MSLGTATLMAISIASASAKDKQSETFLKKAIEGNFAEVNMGELAQQNGQSDAVKSFGRMLSTDHAAANQKALNAAQALGMNSPGGPNAKQKADHDKMSKMSGAGFDKMFATHMVAEADRYRTEAEESGTLLPCSHVQSSSSTACLRWCADRWAQGLSVSARDPLAVSAMHLAPSWSADDWHALASISWPSVRSPPAGGWPLAGRADPLGDGASRLIPWPCRAGYGP